MEKAVRTGGGRRCGGETQLRVRLKDNIFINDS